MSASESKWRDFEQARAFVGCLRLMNREEWVRWARSVNRPDDIPSAPWHVYAERGWLGIGDWLGTGRIANQNRAYRAYTQARKFVRSLGLKNRVEWQQWASSQRRPEDIPKNPDHVYQGGDWHSWGDWLGTGRVASQNRIYQPFEEARAFVHRLGLKSSEEWKVWARSEAKPTDIPANPLSVYKDDGWKGMGDWLGTGRLANQDGVCRPFQQARTYVRSLGLRNVEKWRIWAKSDEKPPDIPANPALVYKDDGWQGMGDWLGTGRVANQNRVFRSFEDARKFVRALGLKSRSEWREWAQSDQRPPDIPGEPAHVYRNRGWQGIRDWLGAGSIVSHKRVYRPFPQARAYAHTLDLSGRLEWRSWTKSGAKPDDIPANPEAVYKHDGWRGMGDWLGTGKVAPQLREYRPFEEARVYGRSLGMQSFAEWVAWSKSGRRPDDIPATPWYVYKDDGWQGTGDWLGTGRVYRGFRPFGEARAFVHGLGLTSRKEWREWAKSDARPYDIPVNPRNVYKDLGWMGMGDWLGTGTIATYNRTYTPFEEARASVRALNLASQKDWRRWAKSDHRPPNIPASPSVVYKDDGWTNWGDWLGTGTVAPQSRIYRPFDEARGFVRSLGLKTFDEWVEWARSEAKPTDIPTNPYAVYKAEGWQGMADWLGFFNVWNRNAIVSFLGSLLPILPSLDPAELYAIMRQNGLLAASRQQTSNKRLLADIVKPSSVPHPEELAERIASELEADAVVTGVDGDSALDLEEVELPETVVPPHDENDVSLPSLDPAGILRVVDELRTVCPSADEEAVEFFIAKGVSKLWREKLANEKSFGVEALLALPAGEYASVVRSRFLEQLQGAETLTIPKGYRFHEDGRILPPNLMQRLVAYRIKEEQRLGNWSGTGAGKTMAAILASRVADAYLTLIVGLNNTLDGWRREILKTFPDSKVIIKERGTLLIDPDQYTYLLLNFESFQQPDSSSMVRRLVEDHHIAMVVLDEVHSVKQREAVASKRRQVLGGLLSLAAERNPDLRVLGMSATPVVNNLTEAVSLLEMVRAVKFSELKTNPTILNVIAVHEKLVVHGVRYRPRYDQVLNEQCIDVPGDHLIDALRTVKKGNVLAVEQVLLEAKLDAIVAHAQPGTLIYTHYVEQIVPRLRGTLTDAGYRVAEFTGDDKSGLECFKRGEANVLLGSSTLGTGVDGLQHVCNRLIIATLPWTSAGYEQLIGRLFRQGSKFDQVDVITPQVMLRNGDDMWSWDIQRRDRIIYKKTLADAAVDGVIPEGVLEPESVMLKRALEALHAWLARLQDDGSLRIIERQRLVIPLPQDDKRRALQVFGDFAAMNARFNNAKSSTTHQRLEVDPSEWYLYHTLYHEARKTWQEVPYEVFIQWLSARPHLVVGDFGCGEAQIAASLPNKVYSFDHVAINESVIACDMTHTGLEDSILDVAIFSLSLMGTNFQDYLHEAHRLLKLDGRLRIAEPAGHWHGEKRHLLIQIIASSGFELIGSIHERGHFLYIDALKV